jgi:hypothetical protein
MVVSAASISSPQRYRYDVERDYSQPGLVDVTLVRRRAPHGRFHRLHQRQPDNGLVMFHRAFRRLSELAALETYAGRLARVAQHANDGTLGCLVAIDTPAEMLQITLYERWFDGQRLHVDELAQSVFDPSDDETLVRSAEFLAELRDWAERRNREREATYVEVSAEETARTHRALDQERLAEELSRILATELRQTYQPVPR